MHDVWRLFAAIDLPAEFHDRVADVAEQLRGAGWRARWTNPAGVHLTLKFYGDVPVESIPEMSAALRSAIAPSAPFVLKSQGAGVFPGKRRPRVFWLGVGGDTASLGRLQQAVEQASERLGFPPEQRAFNPHLTVARFRPEDLETVQGLDRRLDAIGALPVLRLPVERVKLFRSELRRGGAVYTVVDEFPLLSEGS